MSYDREREALARLIACFDILTPTQESRAWSIADRILAAGWMPRPKSGSPEWEAMVERAARELIPDDETPSEGILERAEVMLRAAFANPDTGETNNE